jgi:hypothetical protein
LTINGKPKAKYARKDKAYEREDKMAAATNSIDQHAVATTTHPPGKSAGDRLFSTGTSYARQSVDDPPSGDGSYGSKTLLPPASTIEPRGHFAGQLK